MAKAQGRSRAKGASNDYKSWIRRADPYLSVLGINLQTVIVMVVYVIGYFGWEFTGIGTMGAIGFLWGGLVVIAIAIGSKPDGRRRRGPVPNWARAVLLTAGVVLVVWFGRWVARDHLLHRPLATPAELRGREVVNRTVPIAEVPLGGHVGATIVDKRFENCTLLGPAILAPYVAQRLNTISNVSIGAPMGDVDAVFYELSPGRKLAVGPIALDGCVIERCETENVGWLMTRAQWEAAKQGADFFLNRPR